LWEAETDHYGFAEAMREIDMPILASVLEGALTIVPAELLGNHAAVAAHTESEAAREASANHLDAKLISENPPIEERLAAYIRTRRYNFADLIDRIRDEILKHRNWK